MRYVAFLFLVVTAAHSAEKPAALKPGRLTLNAKDDWIRGIAFSPDGKTIAAGTSKSKIVLWDLASGEEISRGTLEDKEEDRFFHSIVFSPDGKKLATVHDTGINEPEPAKIHIWQIGRDSQLRKARTFRSQARRTGGALWQVTFSLDGKLLATGEPEGTIRLWEVDSGKERLRFHGGVAAAFTPDGRSMISVSHDGLIHRWASGTNRLLDSAKEAGRTDFIHVNSAVFSPAGRLVALSDGFTTWLKDVATGRTVHRLEFPYAVTPLSFSADEKTLATLAKEGVSLFDTAKGKEVAYFQDSVVAAFSGDGRWFARSDGRSIFLENMPVLRPESIKAKPPSDPPRVPLQAELVANRDTYVLALGDLTPQEFSDEIQMDFLPTPLVDLTLNVRNTGDKPITIKRLGSGWDLPTFYLVGSGAINIQQWFHQTGFGGPLPDPITLPRGGNHRIRINTFNRFAQSDRSYWLLPGEYALHAHWHGFVSPVPKGAKDDGNGHAFVSLQCPPIKLKVLPAGKGTAEPLETFAKVPALGALVSPRDREPSKIKNLLHRPVNIDELSGTLQEVLTYLGERYEVKIRIDEAAFKKKGNNRIGKEIIKWRRLAQTNFNAVIHTLLEPLEADIRIDNDTLWIVPLDKPKTLAERLLPPNWIYRGRLYQPVDFRPGIAKGTSLADALEDLSDRFGLIFLIDRKAFEQAGIKDVEKRPVQLGEQVNVRLSAVLRQLLRQAGATFVERENLVLVVPLGK